MSIWSYHAEILLGSQRCDGISRLKCSRCFLRRTSLQGDEGKLPLISESIGNALSGGG